jgi:methionine-rich copper-binding protein CopC
MRRTGAAVRGLKGKLCLGAAAGLLLAGCAGNGQGLDANGQPVAPGAPTGAVPLAADFDSIQANIFTPICSVCHVGGGAPQGLRLDAASSYNLLVGVPSTEIPAIKRVSPGDPDNSYLIQKLEGHASVGARMPFGGPYLSSDTIAFIRDWITNGAQPSQMAAVASAAPARITVQAPEANDFVSEPPPQIMIGFDRELDASRIDSESVRIEKLIAEAGDSSVERIPANVTVSAANPRALMVWPSRPLTVGRYRVVMRSMSAPTESIVSSFEVETLP